MTPDLTATPTRLAEFTARAADQLAIFTAWTMDLGRLTRDTADRLAAEHPAEAAERLPPITKAFDRLARTARQCIALELRLHTRPEAPARRSDLALSVARRQLTRKVEDAIDQAKHPERENLLRDLYERLDDPELDEDLAIRPLPAVIEELRRDLGIGPDLPPYSRPRTPAEIRTLHRRAASRGDTVATFIPPTLRPTAIKPPRHPIPGRPPDTP